MGESGLDLDGDDGDGGMALGERRVGEGSLTQRWIVAEAG